MPSAVSVTLEPTAKLPRVVRGTTEIPAGERPRYACDVVIPYHSGLQWLPAAIEGILVQVSVDVTLHLVNDASPEVDQALRERFSGVPNLRWYRNLRNLGPYVSYHQVWPHLTSDFFAVQDADDVPLPNRLWRAIHALETTGTELYGAAMEQFLAAGATDPDNLAYVTHTPIHRSGNCSRLAPHGHLINGTLVGRRGTIERLGGWWDIFPCGADVEFCTRAQFAGCRVYVDAAVVALRRVHDASLSRGGRWKLGRPDRDEVHAECLRRYAAFRTTDKQFNPSLYGALDRAPRHFTERIA